MKVATRLWSDSDPQMGVLHPEQTTLKRTTLLSLMAHCAIGLLVLAQVVVRDLGAIHEGCSKPRP